MFPHDTRVGPHGTEAQYQVHDLSAIRHLIEAGIAPHSLPTLIDTDEVTHVSIARVHFSDKRPPNLHLEVHRKSGQQHFLHAEYVGAAVGEYARSEQKKLYKSRRGQLQKKDKSGVVVLSEQGLMVRRPGLDARLPGLRLLYHPEEVMALLTRSGLGDFVPISTHLVAHRLGKRAVIRIDTRSGLTLYARLKGGRSGTAHNAYSIHQKLFRRLAFQDQLLIPDPLGFDHDLAVALYGNLHGQQFNPADSNAAAQCMDIASSIAVLQSLKNFPLPVHTGQDEHTLLQRFFSRTALVFPDIAARLVNPLKRIGEALDAEPACERVLCHRDLHPQQIYLHEHSVGILDFDTVCLSNPALDAGNLAAHLFLAGARGQCRASVLEASLFKGFAGIHRSQYDLWRASALMRLVMLYCFSSEPETVITALIDEVSQCC